MANKKRRKKRISAFEDPNGEVHDSEGIIKIVVSTIKSCMEHNKIKH
jgi:hypothetical protein